MWIIKDTMWALKKVFTILFLLGVIFVALCVIVPLFVPHRCGYRDPKNACIANLKQLRGAEETWALEQNKTTNDTANVRDLVGPDLYIRDEPVCMSRGSYTLGRVGEPPRCSVPGHTL